jgi:hypothetical protein
MMNSFLKYITAFFLFTFLADLNGQIRYGQIIGLNLSTMTMINEGKSYTPKISPGIHFGGAIELPLGRNFFFQPALLFSAKGSVYKIDTLQYSISPIYAEVPVIISYSFGSEVIKITLFAGPYFACGIGGNTLLTGGQFKNISYGSDVSNDLKRFDIGIYSGAGLNIKGFLICAQYEYGLTNLSPPVSADSEMKNRVLAISFVSAFGNRK